MVGEQPRRLQFAVRVRQHRLDHLVRSQQLAKRLAGIGMLDGQAHQLLGHADIAAGIFNPRGIDRGHHSAESSAHFAQHMAVLDHAVLQ